MIKRIREKLRKPPGRLVFAVLIVVFSTTGIFALYKIITTQAGYTAAQQEYVELRQYAPPQLDPQSQTQTITNNDEPDREVTTIDENTASSFDLTGFNPDYIGWIRIDGTVIDYPVVQGANNVKYERITFLGEKNSSGTIFMDSRSVDHFKGFSVLYGHNMRDGSMFADLHNFRDPDFVEVYRDIQIFTPDGELLLFNIMDIRIVIDSDSVLTLLDKGQSAADEYFEKYEITEDADILILSTCTYGAKDERLLIFAINYR